MTFTYIKLQTYDEVIAEQVSSTDPGPGFEVVHTNYTQEQMNDFRFFQRTFLDGGYMEVVHPKGLPRSLWDFMAPVMQPIDMSPSWKDITLFLMVDEEGLYKNLSPNVHGTILYQAPGQVIWGKAYLLCERRDPEEGGLVVSFPDTISEAFLTLALVNTLYHTPARRI
jgi:hypothetical protein